MNKWIKPELIEILEDVYVTGDHGTYVDNEKARKMVIGLLKELDEHEKQMIIERNAMELAEFEGCDVEDILSRSHEYE